MWLALLFGCLAPAGAAQPPGPGRIAIAGAYPTGYVGLLARYGLPRDILLDYQLANPDTVAGYDLVILAGPVATAGADVSAGFERLLARGGTLLVDYSASPAGLLRVLGRGRAQAALPGSVPATARAAAGIRLNPVPGNPLHVPDGPDTFPTARIGYVPDVTAMKDYQVLAEYVGPVLAPRRPGLLAQAAAQPNAPAIVLEHRGKGCVLHCGPAVAQSIALQGLDLDALVLALVRAATDGRAVPQLEPEGPHLGRRQSLLSLGRKGPNAPLPRGQFPRFAAPAAAAPDPTEVPAGEQPSKVVDTPARPAGPGKRGALLPGYTAIEADPTPEFNISGTIGKGGDLLLNYWNSANFVRISLGTSGVRIARMAGGRSSVLAAESVALPAGSRFVVKERTTGLLVVAGQHVSTASLAGVCAGQAAARGDLGEPRYQPVEPPCFTDDFMRTSDQDGNWEVHGGTWKTAPVQNPDMGANPFSYKVETTGPACSMNGFPFWDEYRYAASVRSDALKGSVGLGFYAQDPDNMLIFQARVRDAGQMPDGYTLVRLKDGKPTVLAQTNGGLNFGQWYRMEVRVQGASITAYLDGQKLMVAKDTTFAGGEIALRAEDTSARFDDVLVEPSSVPPRAGTRLVGHVPPYAGVIDVDSWAGPATPWDADPQTAGLLWRRGAFYGDVGLRFDLPALNEGDRAALVLDGDGRTLDNGYVLLLDRQAKGAHLELRRAGTPVGSATVAGDGPMTINLRRENGQVYAMAAGRRLMSTEATLQGAGRLAFQAVGFRPKISTVAVWSGHVQDETFDTAPVDWWVGSGDWDVTNRWSCTPDWSWFGGYGEGVAVIWYKQILEGDAVLDFYAGPKMLNVKTLARPVAFPANPRGRPAARIRGAERMSDFNAVLCGDGRSVESGYAFIVADDGVGAKITRKGQVVASEPAFRLFTQGHNRWANIRCEKRGGHLALWVEGQQILQYDDPDPLPGGYAGVWTRNNGIMLPRITLYYEHLGAELLSLGG